MKAAVNAAAKVSVQAVLKGKDIAVTSLSSALAIAFALIGAYVPFLTITSGAIASFSIEIPVLRDCPKGIILSYVASSLVLSFIMPYKALLFILFFGLYPVINYYLMKLKHKGITYILKDIYFLAVLITIYLLKDRIINLSILDNKIILIPYLIIGMAFMVIYDIVFNRLTKSLYLRFKVPSA